MKIEELREIAKARTQGEWRSYDIYGGEDYGELFGPKSSTSDRIYFGSMTDPKFIATVANHIDALLDLWEAAESIKRREEIGGYGHEGVQELLEALERLEAVE